jgi:hypothetical protein
MKKLFYSLCLALVVTFSCDNDDIRIFDKTADERSAEAIAALKSDLTGAENGWLVKYRPVDGTGSYYVLFDFEENNKVTIQTDLGADNGEYQNQTIGYRIDNSLGLELILENYSFFSYLFELDEASFGAEYEFNYTGKTEEGELMFTSKTDPAGAATEIIFQPATGNSDNLLGQEVGINLDAFTNDLDRFSSALKLTYLNKDVEFYLSLDAVKRVISFNLAARKSNPNIKDDISESTGYYLEGNDLVLEDAVQTNVSGSSERIERISLDVLGETSLNVCTDPFIVHTYSGQVGSNNITLETTIADLSGATFATASDFYFCPLSNIRRDGFSLVDEITNDVAGAIEFHLYYGLELANGDELNAIGFVVQNSNGTVTFALKEFTPVLNGNNIVFNFEPGFTLFGEQTTDVVLENINKYLDALTEGNTTYVFKYAEDIYEFNNPCTGWSFVFINGS